MRLKTLPADVLFEVFNKMDLVPFYRMKRTSKFANNFLKENCTKFSVCSGFGVDLRIEVYFNNLNRREMIIQINGIQNNFTLRDLIELTVKRLDIYGPEDPFQVETPEICLFLSNHRITCDNAWISRLSAAEIPAVVELITCRGTVNIDIPRALRDPQVYLETMRSEPNYANLSVTVEFGENAEPYFFNKVNHFKEMTVGKYDHNLFCKLLWDIYGTSDLGNIELLRLVFQEDIQLPQDLFPDPEEHPPHHSTLWLNDTVSPAEHKILFVWKFDLSAKDAWVIGLGTEPRKSVKFIFLDKYIQCNQAKKAIEKKLLHILELETLDFDLRCDFVNLDDTLQADIIRHALW